MDSFIKWIPSHQWCPVYIGSKNNNTSNGWKVSAYFRRGVGVASARLTYSELDPSVTCAASSRLTHSELDPSVTCVASARLTYSELDTSVTCAASARLTHSELDPSVTCAQIPIMLFQLNTGKAIYRNACTQSYSCSLEQGGYSMRGKISKYFKYEWKILKIPCVYTHMNMADKNISSRSNVIPYN